MASRNLSTAAAVPEVEPSVLTAVARLVLFAFLVGLVIGATVLLGSLWLSEVVRGWVT